MSFEDKVGRVNASYKNLSYRFMETKRDFNRQYAHIYSTRLAKMKGNLIKRVHLKYGSDVPIKSLAEVETDTNVKCAIIGTLYKQQELRPSVLKELSDELEIVPQPKLLRFVSDDDKVMLEDELQRIKLIGNIEPGKIVTGIVAALIGHVDNSGKFNVQDICFHGPGFSPSNFVVRKNEKEKYLVMVSGLDIAHSPKCLLALELFVAWVSGWLGPEGTCSQIALVLIAGGLFSSKKAEIKHQNEQTIKPLSMTATAQMADELLTNLADMVRVDIMPGEHDPTNLTLPQQPLHFSMIPHAAAYKSLQGGTNPHWFEIEKRVVLGSSGQPVNNIAQYSDITDPLEGLESTLNWGHLAPTCPDSLACYPYFEQDPFVIEKQPDIYFSSNHDELKSKTVSYDHDGSQKDTLLVCVPSFAKAFKCVMVNLSDLTVLPICFDTAATKLNLKP